MQRRSGAVFLNNKIGQATGFQINWPVIRNIGVWRGGTNWLCINTPSSLKAFLDPSQPPLA